MGRIAGWKIKRTYKDGAKVYVSTPYELMDIFIAKSMKTGRWFCDPNPAMFKERSFKAKDEARKYAISWMRKHPNIGKG